MALHVSPVNQQYDVLNLQENILYPDDTYQAAARQRWLHMPHSKGCANLVMYDGQQPVGSITIVLMPFTLYGTTRIGGMLSDFCLKEEYRVGFNAFKLFQAALDFSKEQELCDFMYGTPNDNSEPLFKRGFQQFEFKKFVKVLDTRPYLQRKFGSFGGSAAGLVANTGLHVISWFTGPALTYAVKDRTILNDFSLVKGMNYPSGLSGRVSGEFVEWRYNQYHQDIKYQYFNMWYNGTSAHVIYSIDENSRVNVMEISGEPCDYAFIISEFESFLRGGTKINLPFKDKPIAICFEFIGYYNLESALREIGYRQRENNHRAYIQKRSGCLDLQAALQDNKINLLTRDGDFT